VEKKGGGGVGRWSERGTIPNVERERPAPLLKVGWKGEKACGNADLYSHNKRDRDRVTGETEGECNSGKCGAAVDI